jgi:hypothetical protein
MKKITREEWADAVAGVIAAQPELASVTVDAMQAGILEAQERQLDRIADISMGLVEALNTKPGQVKRRHDVIVRAIEASNHHPTKWSAEMIVREGS